MDYNVVRGMASSAEMFESIVSGIYTQRWTFRRVKLWCLHYLRVQIGVRMKDDVKGTTTPADELSKAAGVKCFWVVWPGVPTAKDSAVIIFLHGACVFRSMMRHSQCFCFDTLCRRLPLCRNCGYQWLFSIAPFASNQRPCAGRGLLPVPRSECKHAGKVNFKVISSVILSFRWTR